ncbi:MAG: aspartate--ammonia ligase [Mangrovibacterium sp.]
MKLYFPNDYQSLLDLRQTEKAIMLIKDFFQRDLSSELKLSRVTAPLFVMKGTGINDDLNGIERPVSFPVKELDDHMAEIVHSLAKWKRMALADLGIEPGYGLYTDMNALRPDEELDNIHSIYVDQWDWERVITTGDRNLEFLRKIVRKIYTVLLRTEFYVFEQYPHIKPVLPEDISFFHAEELEAKYPELSPKERENKVAKEFGAVFIIGIGGALGSGKPHDGRAPDYDDWTSETGNGLKGLNGDIVVWNPVLQSAFELSSMGIRVDGETLLKQLKLTNTETRKDLLWHSRLLNGEFPLTIGGGIGQSRLCMFFLKKAHIGEIQASLWPEEMYRQCKSNNIHLI